MKKILFLNNFNEDDTYCVTERVPPRNLGCLDHIDSMCRKGEEPKWQSFLVQQIKTR